MTLRARRVEGPVERLSYRELEALPKVGFWKPILWKEDAAWAEPFYRFLNRKDYEESPYPAAEDCVDESWGGEEKALVIAHLKAGRSVMQCRGWSTCRICGKNNGSADLSDGVFLWPEGFAHYVEKHSVKPPPEFIAHVLRSAR